MIAGNFNYFESGRSFVELVAKAPGFVRLLSMPHEPLRVVFAREHTTIFPGLGVFLAGPTPPEDTMKTGWRRRLIERLVADPRLDPRMAVVAPEPASGCWRDIDIDTGRPKYDDALNKQIPWEWQYLRACDITVFWLPTYWEAARSGVFPANIGPTTRWEYGYFLQESVADPRRTFLVGAPQDADSVKWARRMAASHRLPWFDLPTDEKHKLIPDSLVEAVVQALLAGVPAYD